MKTLTNKIAIILSGIVLVIGVSSVNAQWGRNWDGYPNWGGSYQLRQTALNEGYNDGTKAAEDDRGRRSFNDYSAYQKATKGYNSRMGDRELYRRYYQLAFQNGYNTVLGVQNGNVRDRNWNNNRNSSWNGGNRTRRGRNWASYGNYGGSYQMRQTALNAGYNEGNSQGLKDRDRNRRFDPYSQNDYRKANKDYNSGYGDLGLYQRYYREGYVNGYSDAYYYGYDQ
jgi:hypothetical protein